MDASTSSEEEIKDNVSVFQSVLNHPSISAKPFLVIANKQDIPGASSGEALVDKLGMSSTQLSNPAIKVVECSCVVPEYEGVPLPDSCADGRIEEGMEWIIKVVQDTFELIDNRVKIDTKKKEEEEAKKRLEKERRVLRNKIAVAFMDTIEPSLLPADLPTPNPEDAFTEGEGLTFLASEIGEEISALPEEAVTVAKFVGYQRLALQIVGALKAPINKKKVPLTWPAILDIVVELRNDLGLASTEKT